MNHDHSTDQTSCHTPGGLMYIFQGIVFICKLNTKCFCKTIAEVMACTGLQSFTIMHQCFDGVCCYCTCKFFLVCLTSFYHRNSQYFFAEVCIDI